jgi:hypothetical protein
MKYKLTDETKVIFGRTLHQIVCVTAFANVAAGEAGGWIESEKNLDQDGDAWVYGHAEVYGDAKVYGDAVVCGDAWVCGDADYIVLKNNWSSGRYFTYTLSNKKWKVGCFYGASEELIKKAYKDSEISGKCYEASVRYVEQLLNIQREVK